MASTPPKEERKEEQQLGDNIKLIGSSMYTLLKISPLLSATISDIGKYSKATFKAADFIPDLEKKEYWNNDTNLS